MCHATESVARVAGERGAIHGLRLPAPRSGRRVWQCNTSATRFWYWYATLSATLLPESVIFSPSSLFPLLLEGIPIYYIITLDLETLTTLI